MPEINQLLNKILAVYGYKSIRMIFVSSVFLCIALFLKNRSVVQDYHEFQNWKNLIWFNFIMLHKCKLGCMIQSSFSYH